MNTWDKEDMNTVTEITAKLISEVPVYLLSCTPDETAVTALEKETESR